MDMLEKEKEQRSIDYVAVLQRCRTLVPVSMDMTEGSVCERAVVLVWGSDTYDHVYMRTMDVLRGTVARSDVYDGMYTCVVETLGDLAQALKSVRLSIHDGVHPMI